MKKLKHSVKPKLTHDEIVILRNIDPRYQYITRDENGILYVHDSKPIKYDDQWYNDERFFNNMIVFDHLFQFIKWEDDEPYLISVLLQEDDK